LNALAQKNGQQQKQDATMATSIHRSNQRSSQPIPSLDQTVHE
jgi:hypothetical protein